MGFGSFLKPALGAVGGFIGGPGGAIVGDLVGGMLTNKTNSNIAMNNNATSVELSNTAVQRRVEDMKKAGINPILAVSNASGGASTPQLTTPSLSNPVRGAVSDAMAVASNAIQLKALDNDAKLKDAQARNLEEDTRAKNIKNTLDEIYANDERRAGLDNLKSNLLSEEFRRAYIQAQTDVERDKLIMNAIERDVKNADIAKKMQEKDNLEAIKRGIDIQNDRDDWELGLDKKDIRNTVVGRNLKSIKDGVEGAIDVVGKAVGVYNAYKTKGLTGSDYSEETEGYYDPDKKKWIGKKKITKRRK